MVRIANSNRLNPLLDPRLEHGTVGKIFFFTSAPFRNFILHERSEEKRYQKQA